MAIVPHIIETKLNVNIEGGSISWLVLNRVWDAIRGKIDISIYRCWLALGIIEQDNWL